MAAWYLMIIMFAILIPITALLEHEQRREIRKTDRKFNRREENK